MSVRYFLFTYSKIWTLFFSFFPYFLIWNKPLYFFHFLKNTQEIKRNRKRKRTNKELSGFVHTPYNSLFFIFSSLLKVYFNFFKQNKHIQLSLT